MSFRVADLCLLSLLHCLYHLILKAGVVIDIPNVDLDDLTASLPVELGLLFTASVRAVTSAGLGPEAKSKLFNTSTGWYPLPFSVAGWYAFWASANGDRIYCYSIGTASSARRRQFSPTRASEVDTTFTRHQQP